MHLSSRWLTAILVLVAVVLGLMLFIFIGGDSGIADTIGIHGKKVNGTNDKNMTRLAPDIKWLGKEVPPLPEPKGDVLEVANFDELFSGLSGARPGTTILLKEGTYEVTTELIITQDNINIKGASNDRSKVILKGDGLEGKNFIGSQNAISVNGAKNVTIANLTFEGFSVHAISVQGYTGPHNLHVYNTGFIDIGQRSIKVNADNINPPVENGIVEYCYFEQKTDIEKGRKDGFDGDYVAGIDAHHTKNWIIRDNVFKNIRGANGGGRAAIFIWNRSENATVERNLIIGCDRGIAFGNPSVPEGIPYHDKNGIIRNNMIYSFKGKIGIEIVAATDLKVYNNTVVNEQPDYELAVKYAHKLTSVVIANNLVSGKISQCSQQTGAEAILDNNLTEVPADWFVNPSKGNLKLVEGKYGKVAAKGKVQKEVINDFFGRPRKKTCDIGAYQVD